MKQLAPIVITGIILSVLIWLLQPQIKNFNINYNILFGGNLFLLVLSTLAILIQGLFKGPQALVTGYYLSFISKFLLVAISVLVYVKTAEVVSRKTVLILFALYIVYMVVEIKVLIKKKAGG